MGNILRENLPIIYASNFWGTLENGHLTYHLPIFGEVVESGEMSYKADGENVLISYIGIDTDDKEYQILYYWRD